MSGSRRFRELIRSGFYGDAAEIALGQFADGADVIDVSMAGVETGERECMVSFLGEMSRRASLAGHPVMIDTIDPAVIEAALPIAGAYVNSANLAAGEDRFDRVAELAIRHECSLVVGCIDEEGPARDLPRKLALARTLVDRAVTRHRFEPNRLLVDLLAFPVKSEASAATVTLDAIAGLKREFPEVLALVAVSNVSFGLDPGERAAVDAGFLERATANGLDVAIVNCARVNRR